MGAGDPFIPTAVLDSERPGVRRGPELGGADVSYFGPNTEPRSIARQISIRLRREATSRWARRAKHGYSWDSIYAIHIGPLIQEMVT